MEKRIELERRARKTSQITELNLDNCRSTSIVGLTDEYTALETLSLINVGLTTLKGFPKLPNLKKLELSDNRISNGLNFLTTSPKLQYLNLSGNKIKDLEALKPLEAFKNLAVLDLFNNEATQIENYRQEIFLMLPSLKFLDGFDSNDVEVSSDAEEDEELNGNDSEEDDMPNVFCVNGLEIDLYELEELEKRVNAKKQRETASTTNRTEQISAKEENSEQEAISDEVDDLDEYLKELQIRNETEKHTVSNTTTSTIQNEGSSPMSFALLLYWFLAILNLASAAVSPLRDSDGIGEDDDEDGEEDDFSEDEDNGDLSLDEVYNDDLEDDNSDWDEDCAPGEDDEDEETDDEDGEANESKANDSNASKKAKTTASTAKNDTENDVAADTVKTPGKGKGKNAAPPIVAAAVAADEKESAESVEEGDESQARGKKRKHDG